MFSHLSPLRRIAVVWPVIILACGEPVALGFDAIAVRVVAGSGQLGVVGQELPDPLVVAVEDEAGNPIPQQVVNFVVTAGGGSVFAGASSTNSLGIAQERWTLGTNTADSQVVEVRAVDNTTGVARVFGRFIATALAGAPAEIAVVSGNGQQGFVGSPLTDSIIVVISDQYGNGTPSITVQWQVLAGDGAVPVTSTTTDEAGRSGTTWILGLRADTTHVLQAEAGGLAVTATATPQIQPDVVLTPVLGQSQAGTVGQVLPESLVVRVTLSDGRPVEAASVTWTPVAGSVSPTSTRTDQDGRASTQWTLGPVAGLQSTIGALNGAAPLVFEATGNADVPTAATIVAGDAQKWIAGQVLPDSVVAMWSDQYGNPTPGIAVNWQVTTGGGTVQPGATTTSTTGRASGAWILGAGTGPQQLSVTAGGVAANAAATAALPMTQVTAGQYHSCGITSDSTGYCWGQNNLSQLGIGGTGSIYTTPVVVSGGLRFTSLSAGVAHTCGLIGTGVAYCWGSNANGRLGIGSTGGQFAVPAAVTVAPAPFVALDAGTSTTCAITSGGAAHCWGLGYESSTVVPGGIAFDDIVSVGIHACALTSAGGGRCWGNNDYGALGDGTNNNVKPTPVIVSGGHTFTEIRAASGHTCGVTVDSAAYCWGYNGTGALGDGTEFHRSTPVQVVGGLVVTSIGATAMATCALTVDAFVSCWGAGYGLSPVAVPGGFTFAQLAAGDGTWNSSSADEQHWCGVTEAGAVLCWGYNTSGQLGNGTTATSAVPVRAWP